MERTYGLNRIESPWRWYASALAAFCVPFAVYSATLMNGFVYDDLPQILENPWVREPGHIREVFLSSSLGFMEGGSNTYRPILHLLFSIEYSVFGDKAWGFHLVNLLLHSVNTLLVFQLASRLLWGYEEAGRGEGAGEGGRLAGQSALPLFAALVFGLHPVNSEVVSWVSAAPELTFTLFFLVSFYLYVECEGPGARSRRSGDLLLYGASLASFALALLSKETAVALLAVIPAYELSIRGGAGARLRGALLKYLPYLGVAALYMALRTHAVGGLIRHRQVELGPYGVAMNAAALFSDYIKKLLFPLELSALYAFIPVKGLLEPRTLLGVAAGVGLVILFVAFRKRAVVFTSLSVIAAPIIPVLYLPGLSASAFAERYLYLPTVGFGMIGALVLRSIWGASAGSGGKGARRTVAMALALALLGAYGAGSAARGTVWKDNYTLWSDTVEKSPYSPNAHYNLAWSAHRKGELELAVRHYREAIRLDPSSSADAHYNIAVILYGSGRTDEAARELFAALSADPGYAPAIELLRRIMAQGKAAPGSRQGGRGQELRSS